MTINIPELNVIVLVFVTLALIEGHIGAKEQILMRHLSHKVPKSSVKFASQHTGKITVLRHFCLVLQTVFFARLTIDWSRF